ncbi:MAG: NAD(P)/FAD-dependent oxidoreductase [Verrucomicrobiota bacterium]
MKRALVIGAGLSGLACARRLHENGLSVEIVDAADEVGGRVRTDVAEGFLFDRGFQVFLPSYPVAGERFRDLQFHPFSPGAFVRLKGRFHLVSDPFRDLFGGIATAFAPIGSLKDKLLVAALRRHSLRPREDLSGVSSREFLEQFGFTSQMIDCFFRPFFGGVFLEKALETNAEKLLFVFRHFARGSGALPTGGIVQLPRQLAKGLPAIRLNTRVRALESSSVRLENGDKLEADEIVLATDQAQTCHLLGDTSQINSNAVTCLYFSAPASPLKRKCIVINGEGNEDGPINNLAVVSDIAPDYAPEGSALISISILGAHDPSALISPVSLQLAKWFGEAAKSWQYLRGYRIDEALPAQSAGKGAISTDLPDKVTLAGDWLANASIEGAIVSGESAADKILDKGKSEQPA